MIRRTLVLCSWLSCLLCASAAVAVAQSDSNAALVNRGVELRRVGDDEGARILFEQACTAEPLPRSCGQLALAELALGRFIDAERHLENALLRTDDPWIALHRADLELALATIRSRLGNVAIRGGVAGAEVRIDGLLMGRMPIETAIRLPVGHYRVELTAPGFVPLARRITVEPEVTSTETFALRPLVVAVARSATRGDADRSGTTQGAARRRRTGWSFVGLGSAAFASTLATFGIREHAARRFNGDSCLVNGASRGENCGAVRERAVRAQGWTAATFVVGTAFVATGVALLVSHPRDRSPIDARSRHAATPACATSVGARWEGTCTWRF